MPEILISALNVYEGRPSFLPDRFRTRRRQIYVRNAISVRFDTFFNL